MLFYLTIFFPIKQLWLSTDFKNKPNIKYLTNIWYMLGHVVVCIKMTIFLLLTKKYRDDIWPDLTKKYYKNYEK